MVVFQPLYLSQDTMTFQRGKHMESTQQSREGRAEEQPQGLADLGGGSQGSTAATVVLCRARPKRRGLNRERERMPRILQGFPLRY